MRRKRTKKYHFILKISLICALFLTVVSVGYSYLSSVLQISGHVSGNYQTGEYVIDPTSDPRLSVKVQLIRRSLQKQAYQYEYRLDVRNIGTVTLGNFKVTLTFNSTLATASVTDFDYTFSGKILTITNNIYPLPKGKSQRVQFIVSSLSPILNITVIKLEVMS